MVVDVCHLGNVDDHGDSFVCATPVTVGGSVSGEITSSSTTNDIDRFTFVLSSSGTVSIESTGSTDVEADLHDGNGSLRASDDDSGTTPPNFKITQALAAGRYYVRVKGANGSYGVGVSLAP